MRFVATFLIALCVWMLLVAVLFGAIGLLGATGLLAGIADQSAQRLALALGRGAAALNEAGFGGLGDGLGFIAGVLDRNRELQWLIWTFPAVFALMQVSVLEELAASITGSLPAWLTDRELRRRQGSLGPSGKTLEELVLLAQDSLVQDIALQGVFGDPDLRTQIGYAWLAKMRSLGWHAGEPEQPDRLPKQLTLRRRTAVFLDIRENEVESLRALSDRLRRWEGRLGKKRLRILVSCRNDLPHHMRTVNDDALDLLRFVPSPVVVPASRRKMVSTFAKQAETETSKQSRVSDGAGKTRPAGTPDGAGVHEGTDEEDVRDIAVQAPFVFHLASTDPNTLRIWIAGQFDRAMDSFGADGWRLILAGTLLAPAPAALIDRLLPSTANKISRDALFALARVKDDSQEGGLSIPGLLLEGAEAECLRCVFEEAISRAGADEVLSFAQTICAQSADRGAAIVKAVLEPLNLEPPAELKILYPERAFDAANVASMAQERGIRIFMRAAAAKYGDQFFAPWVLRATALLPGAFAKLGTKQRCELVAEISRWESERGARLELALLANAPDWMARTQTMQAFFALLYQHRRKHIPNALIGHPDVLELTSPWTQYASDETEQAFLQCFDTLDLFFTDSDAANDLPRWEAEQVRLCKLLAGDDPVLAMAAAWALYWATGGSGNAPAKPPFLPATIDCLIAVCASAATCPPVWRRAAETLQKLAAPPPTDDYVYDWAVFADGGTADRIPELVLNLSPSQIAPAIAEARARLFASEPLVQIAAAMLMSLCDRALGGRAAAILATALQHPALSLNQEYLLMLRLAQCCDRPGAVRELRRLFVEGLASRDRAFLTLCGMRELDTIAEAIVHIQAREDVGFARTVEMWRRNGLVGS